VWVYIELNPPHASRPSVGTGSPEEGIKTKLICPFCHHLRIMALNLLFNN
jgi:hypothetical protein